MKPHWLARLLLASIGENLMEMAVPLWRGFLRPRAAGEFFSSTPQDAAHARLVPMAESYRWTMDSLRIEVGMARLDREAALAAATPDPAAREVVIERRLILGGRHTGLPIGHAA